MEQAEVRSLSIQEHDDKQSHTRNAVALHDYLPKSADQCVELLAGMIVKTHINDTSGWCYAEAGGSFGWVPGSFLMNLEDWNAQCIKDSLPTSRPSDAFITMVDSDKGTSGIAPLRLPTSQAAILRPLKRLATQLHAQLDAALDEQRRLHSAVAEISEATGILLSDAKYLLNCCAKHNDSAEIICDRLNAHLGGLKRANSAEFPQGMSVELNLLLHYAAVLTEIALIPTVHTPAKELPQTIHTTDADCQAVPIRLPPSQKVKDNSTSQTTNFVEAHRVSTELLPSSKTSDPEKTQDASEIPTFARRPSLPTFDVQPHVPGHLSAQEIQGLLVWPEVLVEKFRVSATVAAQHVTKANMHLLSSVTELIGYMHTHKESSVASSYQRLTDLANDTLNHVRYILAYVAALNEPAAKTWIRGTLPKQLAVAREEVIDATMAFFSARSIASSAELTIPSVLVSSQKVSSLLSACNKVVVTIRAALETTPNTLAFELSVPTYVHRACTRGMDFPEATHSSCARNSQSSDSSHTSCALRHRSTGSIQSIRTITTSESAVSSTNLTTNTDFDTAYTCQDLNESTSVNEDRDTSCVDSSSRLWINGNNDESLNMALEKEGNLSNMSQQIPVTPHGSTIPLPDHEMPRWTHMSRRVIRKAGERIVGGTLDGIVQCMAFRDVAIDAAFVRSFFLCFRMFTTPSGLRNALIGAFCSADQSDDPAAVRERSLQLLRIWIEHHWHAKHDYNEIEPLSHFVSAAYSPAFERITRILQSLLRRRSRLGSGSQSVILETEVVGGRLRLRRILKTPTGERLSLSLSGNDTDVHDLGDTSGLYVNMQNAHARTSAPTPTVSKSLLTTLRENATTPLHVNVLNFDPMELARQITILESKLFCGIVPDEILFRTKPYYCNNNTMQGILAAAPHVLTMCMVTTQMTNWIGECILSEINLRRRAQVLKFFVRLGSASIVLQNYNLLMAIQNAFNSSTIFRLKRTWRALPTKIASAAEKQRRLMDHHRNFSTYRSTLRASVGPAIPFLGIVLTDETFCCAGNPVHREEMINMVRYLKIGRIMSDMQHFQQPYNLIAVDEIQSFVWSLFQTLSSSTGRSHAQAADEQYNRSLMLEPR